MRKGMEASCQAGGEYAIMAVEQGIVLHHPRLNNAALAKLLVELVPDNQKSWYLTTGISEADFNAFNKSSAETLAATWPQGRVFWNKGEIRWIRSSGQESNNVLVLTEDVTLQFEGFRQIGSKWRVTSPGKKGALMAWGKARGESPHFRLESRLPKTLRYPEDCKENGQLLCLYYCTTHGEVQFLRLKGVR